MIGAAGCAFLTQQLLPMITIIVNDYHHCCGGFLKASQQPAASISKLPLNCDACDSKAVLWAPYRKLLVCFKCFRSGAWTILCHVHFTRSDVVEVNSHVHHNDNAGCEMLLLCHLQNDMAAGSNNMKGLCGICSDRLSSNLRAKHTGFSLGLETLNLRIQLTHSYMQIGGQMQC